MWCMELSLRCCAVMNIHRDFRWVSQRISVVSSRESSTCTVFCETGDSHGANEGETSSSRVDLGYTELFCIPEVTSVSFSSCYSVLGDSLVFRQANRGSLHV